MKLFGNKSRNDDVITKGDLAEIKSDVQLVKSIAENTNSRLSEINKQLLNIPQRRAPMNWTLDRTGEIWIIWFDNGSGLKFPDLPQTATVYGYGYSGSLHSTTISQWPPVYQIIGASRGLFSIKKFKESNSEPETYYADSTEVINPIADRDDFDWSKSKLNSNNSVYASRQKNLIRTMYELGIWSSSDVESLGAVRKEN